MILSMLIDLSTPDKRKWLASKWADKYGIDLALICAVAAHESSWNPAAVRFEPAFEARYIKPANPSMPSTRDLTLAMSFGLMQIMGETAVEFGFTGKFLTELCDPDVGLDYGCRKLQKCLNLHGGDVNAGLLAYNGGSDLTYPGAVLQFKNEYE
jgi:soluble lytic murein transglycosylase-like protein